MVSVVVSRVVHENFCRRGVQSGALFRLSIIVSVSASSNNIDMNWFYRHVVDIQRFFNNKYMTCITDIKKQTNVTCINTTLKVKLGVLSVLIMSKRKHDTDYHFAVEYLLDELEEHPFEEPAPYNLFDELEKFRYVERTPEQTAIALSLMERDRIYPM